MGRLGSGPRLVGRIESGVQVSVSFQQQYPGFCSAMSYGSKNGSYDQGGFYLSSSPAYNVEFVTNTSSSSCANNGRRTPQWVLDACRRLSRLCFSHFATRMVVDNTVDLYAAMQIFVQNLVFCLPHLHLTPPLGGGVASEYRHSVWYGKTKMVWLPDGEKVRRYLYSFWHDPRTWQTHTHTHTHTHCMTA